MKIPIPDTYHNYTTHCDAIRNYHDTKGIFCAEMWEFLESAKYKLSLDSPNMIQYADERHNPIRIHNELASIGAFPSRGYYSLGLYINRYLTGKSSHTRTTSGDILEDFQYEEPMSVSYEVRRARYSLVLSKLATYGIPREG
jgi:hypothetical protein